MKWTTTISALISLRSPILGLFLLFPPEAGPTEQSLSVDPLIVTQNSHVVRLFPLALRVLSQAASGLRIEMYNFVSTADAIPPNDPKNSDHLDSF